MVKKPYKHLDPEERELLKIEYKELCQDWRMRDKYVHDKLGMVGVLFALLGLAIAGISRDQHLIRLLLALMGVFFTLVVSISVFKDIYYRDGTQRLLECLSSYMGIEGLLKELECQTKIDSDLRFSRKIKVEVKNTSLKTLRMPGGLKEILSKKDTFKWIFCFYLACLTVFLFLAIVVFHGWANNLIWTFIFCFLLLATITIFVYRGASSKTGDKDSSSGGEVR